MTTRIAEISDGVHPGEGISLTQFCGPKHLEDTEPDRKCLSIASNMRGTDTYIDLSRSAALELCSQILRWADLSDASQLVQIMDHTTLTQKRIDAIARENLQNISCNFAVVKDNVAMRVLVILYNPMEKDLIDVRKTLSGYGYKLDHREVNKYSGRTLYHLKNDVVIECYHYGEDARCKRVQVGVEEIPIYDVECNEGESNGDA